MRSREGSGGDPGGVTQAQDQLRQSEDNLHRDRKETIEPLRREAYYHNNIQKLVEQLLRGAEGKGHGTSPGTH